MAAGWHRNDDDWVQHPKTAALQELLNEPLADAYVERLRCWAGRFRVRGRFAQDVIRHLETLCGWRGEAGKLLRAFVETGWVDERPDGTFEVHDWWEKQGPLVEKAEKDAARKRAERRGRVRRESADASADGPMDRRAGGAGTDETDETRRDVTDETNSAPPPKAPTPVPVPPAPADPYASGEAYFAHVQRQRHDLGGVVERMPRGLSAWWSEVGMELNGEYQPLDAALVRFGKNTYWEKTDPPWPFPAFMKNWRDYVRR